MSHAALTQDENLEQTAAMQGRSQTNDLPVGEILRRARVHYKQSITDIEENLRIPAAQLEAIESGNYKLLPARVYAIGFVRSYAQYLGLDSDHIVRLFKDQSSNTTISPDLHFPVGAEQSNLPSKWIILSALIALIAIPLLWGQFSGPKDTYHVDIPPVSPVSEETKANISIGAFESTVPKNRNVDIAPDFATETLPTTTQTAPPPTTSAPPPVVKDPIRTGITLTITENSWVEIRNAKGKRLVSRVLKAGDQYFVPDTPGLTMSIGNAGGVELSIDGKSLAPLGKEGTVVRNIALDVESLKMLEKKH